MLASASSLTISPFLSPLLGESNHTRSIILTSALVRSVALTIPLILETFNIGNADVLVFFVAILFGPSNSIFGAASEGLMLRSWSADDRSVIARRAGLIRQIALAGGFASAGFLVTNFGSQNTSAIASVLGMMSALIGLRFFDKNVKLIKHSILCKQPYLPKLTEGITIIGSTPMLLLPCVVAILGFSASQMSNALLSPIVTAQKKAASDFGLITSAWAVGAITAALLINMISLKPNKVVHWFFSLLLLGIFCIFFSYMQSTIAQIFLFTAMGAIFSYLRITSGMQIALYTPSERIEKVQLTLSNLISLTAVIIYTIPWLLKNLAPTLIFAIWGITIIIASFGILLLSRLFAKGAFFAKAPPL